ncbi:hypothetical protein [Natrinema ejinorense]|uniref:Uncharacterized protein n=1 Tax=Natrinema ejinorense TaxID=373386 RepID=A0A2A5QTZ1_9EURY|nr:hypothetical protein [Natrinema ejinorense]PCR90311.1 hypothetical protein CP557_07030 [Natrinema ejinorense]
MRIQTTDARERKWKYLKEATGERTVSGALDAAADYYLKMRGDTTAQPTGCVPELIRRADQEGSLTAAEIAEILDVDELPVEYRAQWSIGE